MIALQSLLFLTHLAFTSAADTPEFFAAQVAHVYSGVQEDFEIKRLGFCAVCIPLCRMAEPVHLRLVFDRIDWHTIYDPDLLEIDPNLHAARLDEYMRQNLILEVNRHIELLDRVRRERYPAKSYIPAENCEAACSQSVKQELLLLAQDLETEYQHDPPRWSHHPIIVAATHLITEHIQSKENIFTCKDDVEGRPEADMFAIDEVLATILGRCVESEELGGDDPS